MTTTQTLPVTDAIESMDFQPVCQFPAGCDRTAVWFGETSPCKCIAYLLCHQHKVRDDLAQARISRPRCKRCATPNTVAWRPL